MLTAPSVAFHYVFKEKVALYKALDGSNGKRNCHDELLKSLKSWEEKFPSTSRSNKRISTELTAPVRIEELQVPIGRLEQLKMFSSSCN